MPVSHPPKLIINDDGHKRQCPFCFELYEQDKDGKHAQEVADAEESLTEYIMRCHRCNRKQYFAGGYQYSRRSDSWYRVGPHKVYIDTESGDILCIDCASEGDNVTDTELLPWDMVPEEELIDPEDDKEEERAKAHKSGWWDDKFL